MKLVEIVKAERVIETFAQEKLNFQLSYKIMKIIQKIKEDVNFYDTKAKELVAKYAARNEQGEILTTESGTQIDATKSEEFNKELRALNLTEVEMPDIKINPRDLEDLKLSVVDLMDMSCFLSEEE